MKFRLWSLLWGMALFASAMAPFGILLGALAACALIGAWVVLIRSQALYQRVAGIVIFLGLIIWLMLPRGSSPSSAFAIKRNNCGENIKTIGVALRQYHDANGSFPPAYTISPEGEPLHSWRVLILPYLGEKELFEKIDLEKPWNDPSNSKLAKGIPSLYRCPLFEADGANSNLQSHFYAVLGETTAWPLDQSRKLDDVTDPHSETILLIETAGACDNWMKPQDLSQKEAINLLTANPGVGELAYRDFFREMYFVSDIGREVLFCDAHFERIRPITDAGAAKALLTVGGSETLPPGFSQIPHPQGKTVSFWEWRNIASLSVFVIVSVLPLVVPRRSHIGHES